MGFVRRVASWAGLAGGVVLAIVLVDNLAEALRGSPPRTRLARRARVRPAGRDHRSRDRLRDRQRRAQPLRRARRASAMHSSDRVAGAIVGVTGVLALMWLLDPCARELAGLAGTRGARFGRRARDRPHRARPAARRRDARPPGRRRDVPRSVRHAHVARRRFAAAARSARRGRRPREQLGREGRGHRVRSRAGRHRLRRRARHHRHERARRRGGATARRSITDDGTADRHRRRRVRLRTATSRCSRSRSLDARTARSAARATSTTSARCFGHPGGGPLRESSMRIAEQIVARGTNIEHTAATRREVFVLAAVTEPGDSGAPVVDQSRQRPRRPLRLRPQPPHHRLRPHHHRTQRSPRPRPLNGTPPLSLHRPLPLRVRGRRASAPATPVSHRAHRRASSPSAARDERAHAGSRTHLNRRGSPAFAEERLGGEPHAAEGGRLGERADAGAMR